MSPAVPPLPVWNLFNSTESVPGALVHGVPEASAMGGHLRDGLSGFSFLSAMPTPSLVCESPRSHGFVFVLQQD